MFDRIQRFNRAELLFMAQMCHLGGSGTSNVTNGTFQCAILKVTHLWHIDVTFMAH